jgi:hypothetical protein
MSIDPVTGEGPMLVVRVGTTFTLHMIATLRPLWWRRIVTRYALRRYPELREDLASPAK